MGTKKTTAKAEPAKGKKKAAALTLAVGAKWTDPKTGIVYDMVEGDGSCKNCALHAEYKDKCPMDDPNKPLPCDARQVGNDNGVMFAVAAVHASGTDIAAHAAEPPERHYAEIQLATIRPSPYQTRKSYADVAGLAQSIRTHGVLNPITVRIVDNLNELIAGERRWRAAMEIGLETIPCIVIECDDQTAAEMCVCENMQRKGLSPIEEAEGVNALIGTKHTLDDIANRLGRTRQWVARRASLVNLMPGIKARLEKPDDILSQAPIEILEIMSRMPYDAQERLLVMFNNSSIPSVGAMRARAETMMCSLKNPPFAVKDCMCCTKRTGAEPDLFEKVDGKLGNCLDADCYGAKALAAKRALVEDLRSENADVVIVSKDWQLQQQLKGVQSIYAHTECSKDSPDAIPAVEIKEDGNVRNFFVHKPAERDPVKVEQPQVPYQTLVEQRVVKIVIEWLEEWAEKLDGACADEDAALKTPFNVLAARGEERAILRLVSTFDMACESCEESLSDVEGYTGASFDALMRKLFENFACETKEAFHRWRIEAAYPAAVCVAQACLFATEKQLLDLAKSGLESDGIKDPASAAKPAGKKDKKGDQI